MRFERALPGTNEVFLPDGEPRRVYEPVLDELERTGPERWEERLRRAHGLLLEEQHSFGILEGDKTHPTDWIPRIVPASDWERLRAASEKGPEATLAVVTSGPDDQFYLDHHIYAKEMDAILAETKDLRFDDDGHLVHEPTGRRIDVIYERVDEDTLYAEVPGLLECHVEGKVHVLFAPNSEIIDDKGVYAFVPQMVRTYLGEEPLIENARTWSLALEGDYKYVMDRFGEMVVKSRGGYGGKEVLIGPEESKESVERFRKVVEKNPIEYVAQEMIDFSTHVLCETTEDDFLLRDSYADYRMLTLAPHPDDPDVVETVPGSLSRVATPGKHVVNISSGGKMKDTWVLER